jgi:hypothetical protein
MKREHVTRPTRHPREPAAADLLIELGKQWVENDKAILAADEAGDQRAAATLSERADQLEDEIARRVPSSLVGIVAQLRVLKYLCAYEFPDLHGRLVDNMIAGIEAMIAGAKADRRQRPKKPHRRKSK